MKRKKPTTAKLKKKFWVIFSKYIRTRDNYTCVTCGRKGEGQAIHAGHFIPRSIGGLSLYFHEQNVHAQCYRCNIHLSGNWPAYRKFILKKYGEEVEKELMELKDKGFRQITSEEYLTLIEEYKKKTDEISTI